METISANTPAFEEVKAVRIAVFVNEQGVPPDEEFDDDEEKCVHLGWRDENGLVAAVCRLKPHPPFIKLQRVAVLKSHRMFGAGSKMNKYAIEEARRRFPTLLLVAHAQTTALPFYLKLGFVVVSREFMDEVNILHHTIIYPEKEIIGDYDFLRPSATTLPTVFLEGEYNDPTVMNRIKDVLNGVKKRSLTILDSVMQHVDARFIGDGVAGKFLNFAVAVLDRQLCVQDRVYPLTISAADEEFLIGLAWDKLNTGHYSEVDERWRRFYFACSFVKSIRLKLETNYKDSLKAFDMGLLMGSRLLSDATIGTFATELIKHIPISNIAMPINREEYDAKCPKRLSNSVDVATYEDVLSEEDFLENFLLPSKPVLLRGAYTKWECQAISCWNFPYLHRKLADRTFPVEIGSKYTEEDWSQKLMTGNEFFAEMFKSPVPMYLAQHRLLDQVVDLKEDIVIPPYCFASGSSKQDVDVNVWIGPHGTVSPLHTDPKDNIFVQLSGRKFVRLIAPSDTDKVYSNQDGILTNTSQVDAEHSDAEKFPLFGKATVYDVQVDAGDVLFIPKGWWHYVRSLSPSISLSFWFINDLMD